jgi:hypothetical protein
MRALKPNAYGERVSILSDASMDRVQLKLPMGHAIAISDKVSQKATTKVGVWAFRSK